MSEVTRLEHGQSLARVEPQHCWAVILAGGEGMRLRPLVRQVFGADRPKQYVRLLGPRTLLRQTLDRVSLAIPELGTGHLWNTSVLVGKVATLVQTGWQALPDLGDRLAHIEPFVGTPEEADAVRQAYELMPRANFSKSVLEPCPDALAVSRLPSIVWSGWAETLAGPGSCRGASEWPSLAG